jgi:heptosyltransferase-2
MQSNFFTSCLHFKGNIPCKYHKLDSSECKCDHYVEQGKKILLIKLGRAGDVVRTAPLFCFLKNKFGAGIKVDFVTNYPDLLKMIDLDWNNYRVVDFKLAWTLLGKQYDLVINLDKDEEACSLTNMFHAPKLGFYLDESNKVVCTKSFNDMWKFGIDDNFMKSFTQSYTETLFKAFDITYHKERAIWNFPRVEKKYDVVIIPNAGKTWKTRSLKRDKWFDIVSHMQDKWKLGFLTSSSEKEMELSNDLSSFFSREDNEMEVIGTNSYEDWFEVINQAKTVLCLPSLGLNIAEQLEVPVTLLLNVFSPHEFLNDLPKDSTILIPDKSCLACYKSNCEQECLDSIPTEKIVNSITTILEKH